MNSGESFSKRVQPAMALAAARLDRTVSLADLAERADLSPFHLHRLFAAVAGETPKRYALRLRLNRAAAQLVATNESVLDVALACGFASHEGFTRAFRRQFGMTPSIYRARGLGAGGTAIRGTHVAATHAEVVDRVGPCVGLYHLTLAGSSERIAMSYEIVTKDLAPQPVLLVRRRVKRSEIAATIGGVLPAIFQHAQQRGLALAGHPFTTRPSPHSKPGSSRRDFSGRERPGSPTSPIPLNILIRKTGGRRSAGQFDCHVSDSLEHTR